MHNPPLLLVVDDLLDNLALLEAILAPEGYTVATALSGEQALKLTRKEPPDLVLLDVLMPVMDGFAVCQQLRAEPRTRFVPVIMITALTEVEDRIKGLEAGADDFISKPYHDDLLLAKISSLLRLKQTRDETETRRSDFNNMIIHDLRAPVHSILGLVDLLREDLAGEPNSLRLLSLLEQSARKIDQLATDFLDLGKLEAGRLKLNLAPKDLVAIARNALEQIRPAGRHKELDYRLEAAQAPVTIAADAERLDQVFTNLLQNATKFSPAGGIIAVRIERAGKSARVIVEDQGPGIEDKDRSTIFDKYVQLGQPKSGVGLGLYVCKSIIEAHGGTIRAENAPDGGARFIFDLPLVEEARLKPRPGAKRKK